MTTESPDTPTTPSEVESRSTGTIVRWIVEWVIILSLVIGFTFVLRLFIIQTFSIPSGSMLPTLHIGDRIIVNKLSYEFHDVHRGDIVVFMRPPLETQNYADLVKRVVGLPGEYISTVGGQVYINGKPLAVAWLPKGPQSYTGPLIAETHPQFNMPGPVKIPAGEYFVMGDNRTDSEDSRFFGPISASLIVGRAVAVVWPWSQVRGL